jgi:hypothetical protein
MRLADLNHIFGIKHAPYLQLMFDCPFNGWPCFARQHGLFLIAQLHFTPKVFKAFQCKPKVNPISGC